MTEQQIQQGYHDHAKVDTNTPKHLQCPAYYTHDGWMQGTRWATKELIDKAARWIYNNPPSIGDSMREYIDKFRKAMVE